jgi:hypothetical protein
MYQVHGEIGVQGELMTEMSACVLAIGHVINIVRRSHIQG